jgi:hypothetical protein
LGPSAKKKEVEKYMSLRNLRQLMVGQAIARKASLGHCSGCSRKGLDTHLPIPICKVNMPGISTHCPVSFSPTTVTKSTTK